MDQKPRHLMISNFSDCDNDEYSGARRQYLDR